MYAVFLLSQNAYRFLQSNRESYLFGPQFATLAGAGALLDQLNFPRFALHLAQFHSSIDFLSPQPSLLIKFLSYRQQY